MKLTRKKAIRWLTIPQIKHRSKTAKGALKVSYEHWCQLYDATTKELRAKYKRTRGCISLSTYCGLCLYYKRYYGQTIKCDHCVLGKDHRCGYGEDDLDLWRTANDAMEDWIKGRGDWHARKRAAEALRDKLKELIEQGSKRL